MNVNESVSICIDFFSNMFANERMVQKRYFFTQTFIAERFGWSNQSVGVKWE